MIGLVNRLKNLLKTPPTRAERQFRLIQFITIELIALAISFVYLNTYLHLWSVVMLLTTAVLVALLNMVLLYRYKTLRLSANILLITIIFATTAGNILVGGIGSSYFSWYCIVPLVAATTLGIYALVYYSAITAMITLAFFIFQDHSYLPSPAEIMPVLDLVNYLFIILVMVTTLYYLIGENMIYEARLEEQNYLLQSDKKKFHYLSRHDSLTNLPNRAYFQSHLQHLLAHAEKHERELAIFFMDLDKFKLINDQYGHETGDKILRITSKKLQSCFRVNDFIARIGGDEFTAVVIYRGNKKLPITLSNRIKQEFSHPFNIDGQLHQCHISIGLAHYPKDGQTCDDLLHAADQAMYANKQLNRTSLLDNQSPES